MLQEATMPTILSTHRPIRHVCFILCTGLLLLTCCTTHIPRDGSNPPLSGNPFEDTIKLVTIPLPVIASSPNEGVTTGALTAFLGHNRKEEVTTLLAPQINYNDNFGVTGSLYGAYYPNPGRNLEFNLSHSDKVNQDYELRVRDATLHG